MIARAEIDAVLNARDGASVGQRALEADVVDDTYTSNSAVRAFGQDRTGVGDGRIRDTFVADIADAHAVTGEAGRSACVSTPLNHTGVFECESIRAIFCGADFCTKSGPLIANTGVD